MKISRVGVGPINELLALPEISKWFVDDPENEMVLGDDPSIIYLTMADAETAGAVIAAPLNKTLYHVHIAFLPRFRKHSVQAARLAKEWIFSHTFCTTVVALVPSDNRLAVRMAALAGMKRCGCITNAIHRNDSYSDFIIFEAHKWLG